MTPEQKEIAVNALLTTTEGQCKGMVMRSSSIGNSYCCIGIMYKAIFNTDPRKGTDEAAQALGLDVTTQSRLVRANDSHGWSFEEIGEALRDDALPDPYRPGEAISAKI